MGRPDPLPLIEALKAAEAASGGELKSLLQRTVTHIYHPDVFILVIDELDDTSNEVIDSWIAGVYSDETRARSLAKMINETNDPLFESYVASVERELVDQAPYFREVDHA